ncbi:MAG: S1 RNA-binding domain-containing protein [Actinomycetota bacterium]|nr:S1 RNA-binding domain-containing protein [Actinomycetota bacterium]
MPILVRNEKPDSIELGAVVEGKVVKITNFGAFLDLPDGNSGLLHISEIDHSFVKDVRDFITEDQVVEVKVVGVKDDGKLTLSIKQTTEPQQAERKSVRSHRDPGFEKMLKGYLKSSEQRLADIKRNRMSKRA